MVDVNVVAEKLKQLSLHIAKVRAHCPADPEELEENSDALDLVSFNLLLAVQICLDSANHVIAEEDWEPAATAREAFERLEERGAITRQTAGALRQAVGLRNLVTHGYAGVDPAKIQAAAKNGPTDLERFVSELSTWMAGQTGAVSKRSR